MRSSLTIYPDFNLRGPLVLFLATQYVLYHPIEILRTAGGVSRELVMSVAVRLSGRKIRGIIKHVLDIAGVLLLPPPNVSLQNERPPSTGSRTECVLRRLQGVRNREIPRSRRGSGGSV